LIGGPKLPFENCFATNGTDIFIDSNDLESSISDGNMVIDFEYDIASNDSLVGTSKNNLFSITPIHLYSCYIEDQKIKKEGNSCSSTLTCSLECPSGTMIGIMNE
jgi:hypothetical protein